MPRTWRSNCVIEALRARRRLARGGHEVYLWMRPSRYRWSPLHMGWAVRHGPGQPLTLYSFRPLVGRDVPWYLAWTRLLFVGQVVIGDEPATPPRDPS